MFFKIVIAFIDPPLPFGSAASRWYFILIKDLVSRGHQVTVFTTYQSSDEKEQCLQLFPLDRYDIRLYPKHLESSFIQKLKTIANPFSQIFGDAFVKDLRSQLEEQPFDILHLEQLWAGYLGLKYTHKSLVSVHCLYSIDLAGIELGGIRARIDRYLMFVAEQKLIRKHHFFTSVSLPIAQRIRAIDPHANVQNIGLAMDLSKYQYQEPLIDDRPPVIGLIGSMNWFPTYSAACQLLLHIWPTIKQQIPNAQLQIVGRSAKSSLQNFLNLPDVTIEENVPDIEPYFRRARIFVYMPTQGSGIKIKVAEALAWGIPIVTNEHGVEGLEVQDMVNINVCNSNEDAISRIIALLGDRNLCIKQVRAGRKLAEEQYSPKKIFDKVENVYSKICQK
jgi:polysaccharide biosynthesis protein PslH